MRCGHNAVPVLLTDRYVGFAQVERDDLALDFAPLELVVSELECPFRHPAVLLARRSAIADDGRCRASQSG